MTNQIIKYSAITILLAFLSACSSTKDLSEYENKTGILIETGIASWYGPNFNGKQTASGETYNMDELTAAHRTLPFNSILRVINKSNNKSVIVRINDRGPYLKNRIIDLSKEAARRINLIEKGSTEVKLFLLSESTLPINIKVPHFTVQIGSYKTKSDALSFASRISESRIVEAVVNRQKYYRIYIGLFKEKSDAENKLRTLQNKGIDGFVKQVEN